MADYKLKPGETPEQYKARNNVNTITPAAPAQADNSALIGQLQARLMEQAGAISSSSTNIENTIESAIKGVQSGTRMESERIASQFGREASYAQDRAQSEFQNFSESRSGFGTQMAAFRNLVQTTDKYMKDLDMRKEELILQNNAAGAAKVADLQLKALEYQQKAQQDAFDNIFKSAGLEVSLMAERRAGREFADNLALNKERLALETDIANKDQLNKMSAIAAEYGVELMPGDTMADVVSRVAPMASAIKKAELNRILADTTRINKDLEKNKTIANFQSRIAELMADGSTPATAVMQAMSEGKAIGLDITPELFNAMETFSQETKSAIDAEKKKQEAELGSSYFRSLPDMLSNIRGDVGDAGDAIEKWLTGDFGGSGGGRSF